MGLQVDRARGYGACAACRTSHNLVPYGANIERCTVSSVAASLQQVFFLASIYNSFHHIMALLDLPQELLSRICRFIGLDYQNLWYTNKDFQSLRLTCSQIYKRTTYDAAIRYGPMLHELDINFDHQSLRQILQIVKIPEFRDRIVALTLDLDVSQDLLDPSLRTNVRGEEIETYISSGEAGHLLAECFRWLAETRHLVELTHFRPDSLHVSLAALAAVRCSIKLDIANECLDDLIERGRGDFGRSPATYVPYIRCLSTDGGIAMLSNYDDEIKRALVENEDGYHVQRFRLRHPAIASFFLSLRDIAHLHISGCVYEPHLRFCNACDDMTTYNIFRVAFTNLTAFDMKCMYSSGGRLRRFLKEKDHTLTQLRFRETALTDGSWKTIAGGLERLPFLRQLTLDHALWQKSAVPKLQIQVLQYQPENPEDDDVLSVKKVRHYLSFSIRNFFHLEVREYREHAVVLASLLPGRSPDIFDGRFPDCQL